MNSPAPAPVAGPRPAPSGSVPAWTKPAPAQPVRAGTTNYRRQGSRRRLRADLVDVVLTVLVVIPVAVFIAAAAVCRLDRVLLSDPNDEIFEEYEAALVWSAVSGFDSTAIRLVTSDSRSSPDPTPSEVMVAMMQPLDKEAP